MGQQFVVEEEEDLTLPEDTIFTATLTGIFPKEINWKDKATGEPKSKTLLDWKWSVIEPHEYAGRITKGECDSRLSSHDRNRFRLWAEALLNRELPVGMPVDIDDLVGLSAQITVRHEADRKDPLKVWARVDEVIPASTEDAPPF